MFRNKLERHTNRQCGNNAEPVCGTMCNTCRMHRMGGGNRKRCLRLRTVVDVCYAKHRGFTRGPDSCEHGECNASDLAGMRFKSAADGREVFEASIHTK